MSRRVNVSGEGSGTLTGVVTQDVGQYNVDTSSFCKIDVSQFRRKEDD